MEINSNFHLDNRVYQFSVKLSEIWYFLVSAAFENFMQLVKLGFILELFLFIRKVSINFFYIIAEKFRL